MMFAAAFVAVIAGCKREIPEYADYDNKVYINEVKKTAGVLIKANVYTDSRSFEAAIAKPATKDYTLKFKADASLVPVFNASYYENAQMLPAEIYTLTESEAVIQTGGVRSTPITVDFKDINTLDRDLVYVLPVTLAETDGMAVLESARTMYYVFKGAALVNVVADIDQNSLKVVWANTSVVSNLSQVTFEALVRARAFTRTGSDSEIMSVMGVEGYCLIRTGDSNYPGQLQWAFSGKNYPGKDATKVIPLNQWVHIATTYDANTRKIQIYVDGVLQSEEASNAHGNLSFAGREFYIGKSWNDNRWWQGEICEVRIWSKARTQQEIASSFYEVDPASEGLVSYWKFDEGEGTEIKDHTGNGNKLVATSSLKWTPVSLPEKK